MKLSKFGYAANFFETSQSVFKIAGVYVPNPTEPTWKKLLFILYNLITLIVSIVYFICELLILNETVTELGKFIAHFGMLFTHIVGIGKFYIVVIHRKKMQRICDYLQADRFKYEPCGTFQPAEMFNREKLVSKVVMLMVFLVYSGVGISAHISALVTMHFSDFKAEKFDGNTTCQDFLPYYSYIPFGVETKSRCKWAFFFMDIPLDFLAWYIAAHDGNFVAILNCLKTQLLILCGAFTSIRERTLMKLSLPPNYEVFHDEENPILEAELYAEMKHCTIHLMLLLNVCQEVEKIFNFVTLAQTLASLLIFASCLFVATSVPMTSPIFFSQLEYFVAVLIQLSTFCWFGNEMSSASEAIRNALYESKWLSTSRRFRLSMMLNICRMQRQVYVSIGKFSPLTLVTLVSVMRGSFSYFAVFKNVQN